MDSQDQHAAVFTGGDLPTVLQLEYMAYQGQSERVHSIYKRLPSTARHLYASHYILSQVVRGGVSRLRSTPPEAVSVIAEEHEFVEDVLALFVARCRREGAAPRELFIALLDWARLLLGEVRLAEALAYCDMALALGAKSFPDLYPRVLLLKADVHGARGEQAEAHSTLRALYDRMDLVSDRNLVSRLTLDLARTSLLTGQVRFFKRLLFDGLKAFYRNTDDRRLLFDLIRRTYRRSLRVLTSAETPVRDRAVFLLHWVCLGLPSRIAGRLGSRLMERGLLVGVYLGQYMGKGRRAAAAASTGPTAASDDRRLLVTRAMGGLGDLLMLTPALHALRLKLGAPVRLAVPRRFFPLFEGNDDVRVVDIHSELEPRDYDRWFNLTDCPAARGESLTVPRVRRNRIELFARGLGIRGPALWRMDRKPRYFLSEADHAYRERFFAGHGLKGRSVIGVQIRSDETYRDYPHMPALVKVLARDHVVLLFDSRPIAGYDFANVVKVGGQGLREAAALASGCRALVGPDSSFIHLAAALGRPAVGLFGPTDGAVRTSDYPHVRYVDVRRDLRCVPCWRNEEIPCALTGLRASVCLAEIGPLSVAAELEDLLRATGDAGASAARVRVH